MTTDDSCITPGRRNTESAINTAFDDTDIYGYTIDSSERTVRIHGNDEENGTLVDDGGKCLPVDDGATEDIPLNSAPTFGTRPETRSVDENTEAGEDIGEPVTASDFENDDLTYSLTGTDAIHFDIDSSTGQIETHSDLDYETKDTYHLAVEVTDGKDIVGDPDSAIDDSIDVTITVDDVNEPPVFDANAPTTISVMENTAAGENIDVPITATDPEDGDTVTYSLDTGDGASFGIDSSGQIKTKGPLDVETKDTYTVTVTASDGDEEATHDVTITVTEANDPPAFTGEIGDVQTSVSRSVAENTAPGESVGAPVSATDEENDTLTYSLDEQAGANFEIDAIGQIKTKEVLNYEDTQSYLVTVSVTDSEDEAGITEQSPTVDATIEVTITVTDVNEPPTFADDAPTTLEVAENTPADTDITGGLFTATDPDTTNDTLTYSLGGTDAASFEIDTSTGQLKTKADLDYEGGTNSSYSVDVQVSDGKDASGDGETPPEVDTTLTVAITVTNVERGRDDHVLFVRSTLRRHDADGYV